jgi:hypothetical protein
MPNGYLVYSDDTNNNKGLAGTLDINLTTNQYELGVSECSTSSNCFNPAANARRRVRSAGMIKKNFNTSRNNDTYCTSTTQYLNSRNLSFQQNQYNYIRQGIPSATPGTLLAAQNIYSPNAVNHCPLYEISAALGNNTFQYDWIETTSPTTITVTIPDGFYDIDGVYSVFKTVMIDNKHYYESIANGSYFFLLNITYNTDKSRIELQAHSKTGYASDTTNYKIPTGASWTDLDTSNNVPVFIIPASFSDAIGFAAGNYPASNTSSDQYMVGTYAGKLLPNYVQVYYKPNNPQFAQQGAVSSSSLITRKVYDTVTKVGSSYRSSYGDGLANAMAYGVPNGGYNIKWRYGYPEKRTPVIDKYTGEVKCATTHCRIKV